MTKLLARINQIELVLSSLMDECTEADPRQLAIARTEFEKAFVWLKHVAKDELDPPTFVPVSVPFITSTNNKLGEHDSDYSPDGMSIMAKYNGHMYYAQGTSQRKILLEIRDMLLKKHPNINFSLVEVSPIEVTVVALANGYVAKHEGKVSPSLTKVSVVEYLNREYPNSIYSIVDNVYALDTYLLPGEVNIDNPYGHPVVACDYAGETYIARTLVSLEKKLKKVYPNTNFTFNPTKDDEQGDSPSEVINNTTPKE